MTRYSLLFLFLLAHIIGDFTLQSSNIVKSKGQYGRGYFYHILIVLISYLVITFFYFSTRWIYAIAIIVGTHALTDYLKIKVGKTYDFGTVGDSIALLIDQILHLFFIFLAFYLFAPWKPDIFFMKLFNKLVNENQIINHLPDKIIFLSACYLFLARGGTVFVRTFSGRYRSKGIGNEKGRVVKGAILGEIERLTIFTFFVLKMYVVAVLLIALKFFAQYYLSKSDDWDFKGSIYSILVALVTGIIYNAIFIW